MADTATCVELVVEAVPEVRGRVYVFARIAEGSTQVPVTSRSTLDGVPVEPWLEVPRSIAQPGALRTDLIAFCLRFSRDRARFQPGRTVVFVSDPGLSSKRAWLDPWQATDNSSGLERELSLEVGPGHPLFRVPVVALGRRVDADDVLFALQDEAYALAWVHLTWSSTQEQDSRWPSTKFFQSWEDWVIQMSADHEMY
jgi:hypothetical protein